MEIFELILCHLNGIDLARLRRTNKKFKKSLNNPTALRLIFSEAPAAEHVTYIGDDVNWNEEVSRQILIRTISLNLDT